MATQLTSELTGLGSRALVAALGVLVVLAALTGWRALTAGPTLLTGTVAVVNDAGTKFCIAPESGEQWCGALATSGGEAVTVGHKVTVLVNSLNADPRGTLDIGTVVPAGFTVKGAR